MHFSHFKIVALIVHYVEQDVKITQQSHDWVLKIENKPVCEKNEKI